MRSKRPDQTGPIPQTSTQQRNTDSRGLRWTARWAAASHRASRMCLAGMSVLMTAPITQTPVPFAWSLLARDLTTTDCASRGNGDADAEDRAPQANLVAVL